MITADGLDDGLVIVMLTIEQARALRDRTFLSAGAIALSAASTDAHAARHLLAQAIEQHERRTCPECGKKK